MMQAERAGDHAQADELAFTAWDYGNIQPLRYLLWTRLTMPDIALGVPLALKAIDAGEASIVAGLARHLAREGHHHAV